MHSINVYLNKSQKHTESEMSITVTIHGLVVPSNGTKIRISNAVKNACRDIAGEVPINCTFVDQSISSATTAIPIRISVSTTLNKISDVKDRVLKAGASIRTIAAQEAELL